MRLVSQELNNAVSGSVHAPANFCLFFNKMLEYVEEKGIPKPRVKESNGNWQPVIAQYEKSRNEAKELLKHRHLRQAGYCRAMEKAGWKSFIVHARLTSPFVSGLGAAHPTETGLVLDHTIGVPYIPAAGQKGVMRLAHIINSLLDENGEYRDLEELINAGLVSRGKEDSTIFWLEDDASKTLFGSGGDKDALAGQMVVLDAYPLTPPELGEEILNPHYSDYYKGKRGPTEDQSPIPVRFLVVKPGAEFVFRVLLRLPFADAPVQDMTQLATVLRRNLVRSITTEGFGAKTALGFGRFSVVTEGEAAQIERWRQDALRESAPWLLLLERIASIQDWGQLLQQVLDNAEAGKWQSRRDVAEAVKAVAERIRDRTRKKWTPERDDKVAAWLNPAGVEWACLEASPPVPEDTAEEGASPLLAKIRAYADWGAYKVDPVDISTLDKPCALALQKKFKAWKCDGKRARGEKKAAWEAIRKRLRQV